jgi:hypothetical protein
MKNLNLNQMEALEGGVIVCMIMPDPVPDFVQVCLPDICPPGMVCPL